MGMWVCGREGVGIEAWVFRVCGRDVKKKMFVVMRCVCELMLCMYLLYLSCKHDKISQGSISQGIK